MTKSIDRRPLESRAWRWPHRLAALCARVGISANLVSASSIVFATLGGAAFLATRQLGGLAYVAFIAAAVFVQLRLLANLLDGLIAVEQGKRSVLGDLWNDVPDRFADVLLLVGSGYALSISPLNGSLGWAAGSAALLTAYVRFVGSTLLGSQNFQGPMAKPHRMFVLTVASLIAAVESLAGNKPYALLVGLLLITVGAVFTFFRRLRGIADGMRAKAP